MVALICVMAFASCVNKNDLEDFFLGCEAQSNDEVAIVLENDYIIIGDKTIDYSKIVNNAYPQEEDTTSIDPILCINNNCIYGIKSYCLSKENKNRFGIDIYSINIETEQLEIVYSGEHYPRDTEQANEFVQRAENIFFYDGAIIIKDGANITEYEIDTRQINVFDYNSYNQNSKISWKKEENIIKVQNDSKEFEINIDFLANKNSEIEKISNIPNDYKYDDKMKETFYKRFLTEENYLYGEKLYLICDVKDKQGESTAILVSCDLETQEVQFLYWYFTWDVPTKHLIYPIPIE